MDGGEDENEDEFARPLDTSDEEEEEEDKTVEQVFKRWLVEFPSVPSTAVDSLIKYVKFWYNIQTNWTINFYSISNRKNKASFDFIFVKMSVFIFISPNNTKLM